MNRPLRKTENNLSKKYQKIVDQVIEDLKRRKGVEAILLSGSVARGDFTPYSDIELNVIVNKEVEGEFDDEDLYRSREKEGVFVEIYYASADSWKREILSEKEEPRVLNQFCEAKILYDPHRVAKHLVDLAKKAFTQFNYPSRYVELAKYATKHNRNKILSRLYQGKQLAAAIDADIAVSWILRGLTYLLNIPNTEVSRNVEEILASKQLTEDLKRTLMLAIKGNSRRRTKASIRLCDLYLEFHNSKPS